MTAASAAILFTPTLVGGIYGKNFDGIRELQRRCGYAFAIVLMPAVAATLHVLLEPQLHPVTSQGQQQ